MLVCGLVTVSYRDSFIIRSQDIVGENVPKLSTEEDFMEDDHAQNVRPCYCDVFFSVCI